MNRPRLFLITPPAFDPVPFGTQLEAALSGGDVACVLIYMPDALSRDRQKAAEQLVPIIQKGGGAAIVYGDTQAAGRSGADGVHIDTSLEDLKLAVESFKPDRIVGAGGTKLKHEDMEWAETGIDYLFYGRLDLDEREEAHPKTIQRAGWWAELFQTPCVALAGNITASAEEAAKTGADFVALKDAIWQHADGPAAAVREANTILEQYPFDDGD
ncbi:thiamine phosphate synthase [Roseibium aquae]|uniref:Thiamine phosphate synthase n=1 Tax=Roseibium aquae TaxID=1323746 RepID=A0A916WV74_9HYPH|nr:thiamine phosphate synthase [Roseibium aquae]GGB32667.1 thiamine phosphate synthase [Roseibium aquae]